MYKVEFKTIRKRKRSRRTYGRGLRFRMSHLLSGIDPAAAHGAVDIYK
jgi:hypothetical protein